MGPRRKGWGFTLLELLTVIAIITILAGLALGGITTARLRARIAATRAEIKRLGLAVDQFNDDFGYYPPTYLTQTQVSNLLVYKGTGAEPARPVPNTWPRVNFVDTFGGVQDTFAQSLRAATDGLTSLIYEQNGIECLILYLSTKAKGEPYIDTDAKSLVNTDGDLIAATSSPTQPWSLFNSAFSRLDSSGNHTGDTYLYEWVDSWGRPLVYLRNDYYNRFQNTYVPSYGSPLRTYIDGQVRNDAVNAWQRVSPVDEKTGDFFRGRTYVIYSFGPNGIDNLGYSDSGNGRDDDWDGTVDNEDDITLW